MQVILLKNVTKLGQEGEVKNVALGFARNFLIPQKLAVPATPDQIKLWEKKKKLLVQKKMGALTQLQSLAKEIEKLFLKFKKKANKEGKLFGSLGAQEIGEKLAQALGQDIKSEWIRIESPIKELGEHKIKLILPEGVFTQLKIIITPEEKNKDD